MLLIAIGCLCLAIAVFLGLYGGNREPALWWAIRTAFRRNH